MDIITLAIAKKYTKDSIMGLGAIKGSPCTVQSIVPVAEGNRVTFAWTNEDGVTQTMNMIVKDGDTPSVVATPDPDGKGTIITITDKDGTSTALIEDGVSPTVVITEQTDAHKLAITDKDGTKTTVIKDGYSPKVVVTDNVSSHKVAITDKDGTKTTVIDDGYSPEVEQYRDTSTEYRLKIKSKNRQTGQMEEIITPNLYKNDATDVEKNYNALDNRPKINGHVLSGDQTHQELGIVTHEHNNKTVIDKFSTYGGKLQWDGKPIEGGEGGGLIDGVKVNNVVQPVVNKYAMITLDIPTAVSQLTNDLTFVSQTVNNLTHYYTKEQIDAILSGQTHLDTKVVSSLPTTGISTSTIYLLKNAGNSYDQFMYIEGTWENIGSTDMNLNDYVTNTNLTNQLTYYVQKNDIAKVAKTNSYFSLDDKPTIPNKTSDLLNDSEYVKKSVTDALPTKEYVDTTIDNKIKNSANSVKAELNSDYDLNIKLLDKDGLVLSQSTTRLPLESVVKSGRFDTDTNTIFFILDNGNEIEVPLGSLVSGLVTDDRTIAGIDLKADISRDDLVTAIGAFEGATDELDGKNGVVPKPLLGDQNKFLKADGTWSGGNWDDDISDLDEAKQDKNDSTLTTEDKTVPGAINEIKTTVDTIQTTVDTIEAEYKNPATTTEFGLCKYDGNTIKKNDSDQLYVPMWSKTETDCLDGTGRTTGWTLTAAKYDTCPTQLRRVGNMVSFTSMFIWSSTKALKGTWLCLGKIPSGFRPKKSVVGSCGLYSMGADGGALLIYTSGTIKVWINGDTGTGSNKQTFFSISYEAENTLPS